MSIRSILENSRRFLCGNIRTEQNRYYFRMYTKYIVTIQYIYTFVTFGICYTAISCMLVSEMILVYVYLKENARTHTHTHTHTHAHTHIRTHTYPHIRTQTHTNTQHDNNIHSLSHTQI